MEKKSILIVDPFEKMNKTFIDELSYLGYNTVALFKGKMKPFDYSACSNIDKLKNIFQRSILKNPNYYYVLVEKFYQKYTESLLEHIIKEKTKIDYALVFRPHGFSSKFYYNLRKITSEIALYEYDGLDEFRTSVLKKNQKYVKNTFLFDFNDLHRIPSSKFITNYHYNHPLNSDSNQKIDFYYLGTQGNNRIEKLQSFIRNTSDEFKKKIIVQMRTNTKERFEQIELITQAIDYKNYLHSIQNTKAIIDIKSPKHDGLSFRFFEALNFEKKIITNNHSVKKYNFYHPDNIYVTEFETFEGLEDFMQKPYHTMPKDIVKMYSLENWIKNIFEMDDYIPIPIPTIKN